MEAWFALEDLLFHCIDYLSSVCVTSEGVLIVEEEMGIRLVQNLAPALVLLMHRHYQLVCSTLLAFNVCMMARRQSQSLHNNIGLMWT